MYDVILSPFCYWSLVIITLLTIIYIWVKELKEIHKKTEIKKRKNDIKKRLEIANRGANTTRKQSNVRNKNRG